MLTVGGFLLQLFRDDSQAADQRQQASLAIGIVRWLLLALQVGHVAQGDDLAGVGLDGDGLDNVVLKG